jgi:hypothetical protein
MDHPGLVRAVGSGLEDSGIRLRGLVKTFDAGGPLGFGIEECIERGRGEKIAAKGIDRAPVRSSKRHFVKASGLRWVRMRWLTRIAFAQRVWALPFMTALAPWEHSYPAQGRKPQKITAWARPRVCQVRGCLPERDLALVGDSAEAALACLDACVSLVRPVTVITRLRLDAAWYEPAPPYPGNGRPRKTGRRWPTPQHRIAHPDPRWQRLTWPWYDPRLRELEIATFTPCCYHSGLPALPMRFVIMRHVAGKFGPQALLSTDLDLTPEQRLAFFRRRWPMDPTFRHVRDHLAVETQRHWSDTALARPTPVLLGLFSLVTRLAHTLLTRHDLPTRPAAGYPKPWPTFADALALVRPRLWAYVTFHTSAQEPDRL